MARSTISRLLAGAGTAAALLMGSARTGTPEQIAHAQGTPGLMEFRWDNDRDYRKLYYYQTSSIENDRSEWYLTLREKDRKTAILKLTVTVPDYFDSKLKPHRMRICRTSVGSMMSRSKCLAFDSVNGTVCHACHNYVNRIAGERKDHRHAVSDLVDNKAKKDN